MRNSVLVRIKDIKSNRLNSFVDGPFGSNLKTEHFIENGDVYVIDSGYITSGNFYFHRDFKTISYQHFLTVNRSECTENDIIIAKIGANFGMSAILPKLDKKSLVSGNTLKLTLNTKKYFLKFIHYYFLYLKDSGQIDILVKGSAQPALSMGLLNDITLLIPKSFTEQTQIANYLDTKTQAIDKKINLLTTKIEYYKELRKTIINNAVTKGLDKNVKLKESELGLIPKHWTISRLKEIDLVIMGQSPKSDDYNFEGKGFPFLQGNAEFGTLFPVPSTWCEVAVKVINVNDIMLSVRAPIGAVNIANQKYGIGRGLCAIRAKKSYFKYLYYYCISQNHILQSLGTGTTYIAISLNDVANILVAFPPKQEQTEIATYLDTKTSTIDKICTNLQTQIETLKELRKTLINDVVTGKVKVN